MNLFTSNFKYFFYTFLASAFILLIGTFALIERKLIKLENERNQIKSKQLFSTEEVEILAFGDSRVQRSFISSTKFNNLGRAGYNIDLIYNIIKFSIAKNKGKIKNLILQADPHMFSFYRIVNYDNSNKKTDIANAGSKIFRFLEENNRKYLIAYSKDVWRKFLRINQIKTNQKKNDWDTKAKIRVQLHNPVDNFLSTNTHKKYIEIIQFLKKEKINICLISFPVSPQYNKHAKRFKNYKKAKHFFKNLALKTNIDYFDLSEIFDKAKFTDPDHISTKFSLELTKIIEDKCRYKLVDD